LRGPATGFLFGGAGKSFGQSRRLFLRDKTMTRPTPGIASIRLRPGMSTSELQAVGEVYLRDFGKMVGPKLLIAGVPLDLAHKLVEVGLIESKTHGNLNDEQ